MNRLVLALIILGLGWPFLGQTQDVGGQNGQTGTVVLAYSQFGADTPDDISIARFEQQLEILNNEGYRIQPLTDLAGALRSAQPLADRTVAITIDNAYANVGTMAIPRLKAAKMPFTLFIATDLIDGGDPAYMRWDQIRDLAHDPLVSIGLRGAAHLHLASTPPADIIADIRRARQRLKAETGIETTLFSYPYGEYSDNLISLLRDQGFDTAFGIHSGVVGLTSDPMALPRFPMTGEFGDAERFRLSINTLPLPVYDATPNDSILEQNPPDNVAFTVDDAVGDLSQLRCYASDQGQVPIEIAQRRVRISIRYPFDAGRARLNCTIPALYNDGPMRWRWYGRQFTIQDQ